VDNDAVRLAVHRGASLKLGHMRKHAQCNLQFLKESGVEIHRVDTTENPADIFTKIVSVQRLEWHMCHFTGQQQIKNEHGSIIGACHAKHSDSCSRCGLTDVGCPRQVLSCNCIKAARLAMLLTWAACAQVASADGEVGRSGGDFSRLIVGLLAAALVASWLVCAVLGRTQPGETGGGPERDEENFVLVSELEQEAVTGELQRMHGRLEQQSQHLSDQAAQIDAQAQYIQLQHAEIHDLAGRLARMTIAGRSSASAAAAATVPAPTAAIVKKLPQCGHPCCKRIVMRDGMQVLVAAAHGERFHPSPDCSSVKSKIVTRYIWAAGGLTPMPNGVS